MYLVFKADTINHNSPYPCDQMARCISYFFAMDTTVIRQWYMAFPLMCVGLYTVNGEILRHKNFLKGWKEQFSQF